MSINKMMSPKECAWSEIFDEDERITLQEGFMLTGIISVILSLWLNCALLTTNLKFDRSYRNLAYFTLTACIRRVVPALSFIEYMESWQSYQNFHCDFFAFWETFLAVLEVECLTHVCIERYVLAKYNTNGWPIQKQHYTLYPCLCFFFSTLYSYPPVFGIGRFGYDFTCTSCTFDMVLPNNWQRSFVLAIFFLRSVKPAVVMSMMLIWCRLLEKKYNPKTQLNEINFTRVLWPLYRRGNLVVSTLTNRRLYLQYYLDEIFRVFHIYSAVAITCSNLLCWLPIALIRGSVVITQLFYTDEFLKPAAFYIKWAMWLHWVSPAVTAVTLFMVDDRIRHRMISLCYSNNNIEGDKDKDN